MGRVSMEVRAVLHFGIIREEAVDARTEKRTIDSIKDNSRGFVAVEEIIIDYVAQDDGRAKTKTNCFHL